MPAQKLFKNDDGVLAERALVNARRLAPSRRERAHAWYALSRRRGNIKRKLRELQVDHAIQTNRRPNFCSAKKKNVKVPCFIHEKNDVLVTDDEKRDAVYNHFDRVFHDIDSVLDLVPDWLEKTLEFCGLGYVTKFRCFDCTRSFFDICQKKNLSSRRHCY